MISKYINDEEPDGKLKAQYTAYLEVTLKNAKIDYLRIFIRRRNREELYEMLPEEMLVIDDLYWNEDGNGFQNEILDISFASLPLIYQRVLICSFVHGMTAAEISDVYGYSKAYVYKLREKALLTLKRSMLSKLNGGD